MIVLKSFHSCKPLKFDASSCEKIQITYDFYKYLVDPNCHSLCRVIRILALILTFVWKSGSNASKVQNMPISFNYHHVSYLRCSNVHLSWQWEFFVVKTLSQISLLLSISEWRSGTPSTPIYIGCNISTTSKVFNLLNPHRFSHHIISVIALLSQSL